MHEMKPPAYRGFLYYLRCTALRRPYLVNLELTKRCNARCSFCTYWQLESGPELDDYGPVVEMFRPVVLSITGGEPLLRKDYDRLLAGVRPYCHYLSVITNGALLNPESARRLRDAGANQISVSLDYLSSRHDEARMIAGLYDHVSKTVPALSRKGYRLSLNTVIMDSNLDEIIPLAHRAKEWGIEISYSAYCLLKSGSSDEMVREKRYSELVNIIRELMRLKRRLRNIKNSDHYLERIPAYFRDGVVGDCKAGYRWIQVAPDGSIQQCSELPRLCHYKEFTRERLRPVSCAKCWYTCRGEAEANFLAPKRFLELIRS